ncbi:PREDICTED: uncharacterized protein LOC104706775 isoform X2 [Camelina sativa]|uniref:Uncharacterized protein LOC104706775 isoform X2 n=1 Tax=Camelina sativa TaxID=90675 RepID=A0ABM0T5S6_CAMSA|nr:PREDICTED: uncharacterized protein LOC104706775 isoform X2 [Camelina sativa]
MKREYLDYTLVPLGLALMVFYHLWLLYRIINRPSSTVVGLNAFNRRLWVQAMMEDSSKNGVLAVQTLRNNIMASTLLASTAIMLCSLIAVLMTSGTGERSVCHASILINVPFKQLMAVSSGGRGNGGLMINQDYVAATVNRGSYFWSLGLRAFYFSSPLFLWIFGPIPMFITCCVLVCSLYFLDLTFDSMKCTVGVADGEEPEIRSLAQNV